ncbi:ROK family protein [Alcaligenes faecalis]|jgi:predicted NBD/HSP70 family sugar kinase|uniref:ROK family protein n=1 Tax=Alcaligenes faecalis TaxID=511 RepID=A0ABY7MXK2_ALCFA|nr:ROK family protein [Alcaligenes faecalis]MBH0310982.1 ROK family protein [Alcaligenes faecalis]MBW4790353.1 ROK family protein [Alcaligenes faecalis subsp. faecalis]WBM36536.1 ROK family protein [Alcaligenes faecalis]
MMNQIFQSAVGVDLGGTKLLLRYRDHSLRFETGPDFGAADLTEILKNFIRQYVEPGGVIGIAVPGVVENDTVVACDVLPELAGWKASTLLCQKIGQVSLANDANAALHATVTDLASDKTAITVMVGTAIGCGLMIDGKVFRGAKGWAGELGYWPVQTSGSQWSRLDDIAGGRYMANRLNVDANQLALLSHQGHQAALEVIAEGGRALGRALGGIINLLNPHRLSVGGGTLKLVGYWAEAQTHIKASAIPSMLEECEIRTVHELEDIVAMGAAQIALTAFR